MPAPASKPQLTTLGELTKSGYTSVSVRDEIRRNLLAKLRKNEPVFDGIVGYELTVIPQVINALLSRHNLILLGLRGQAKTRLMRQIANLLDPWLPIVAGSEINDDPLAPISRTAKDLIAELGERTPIEWVHRHDRYREKLATPDVSIADLIGDLDPVKAAAQRLSFSHESVINFGLVPRTNRGIFAINELPDLQARIQVGLLNILEERDVQIRGFPVRLPLDILLLFTANPEDYTNRGSIITPLKDRIESQILTHYPRQLDEAQRITDQEAWIHRGHPEVTMPGFVRRVVDRIAFLARQSDYVDQNSGVSARLPIAALENVLSNAERRAAVNGTKQEWVRVLDVFAAMPAITGKLELVYEGEQEGAFKVATNLVGQAVRAEFEDLFGSAYSNANANPNAKGGTKKSTMAHDHDVPTLGKSKGKKPRELPSESDSSDLGEYKPIIDWFSKGHKLELTDTLPWDQYKARLETVPGLKAVVAGRFPQMPETERVVAMELVLEGLHQSSLLAKEDLDRGLLYCDLLGSMFEDR